MFEYEFRNPFLDNYVKDERMPVFCVNLWEREDKYERILNQFEDKLEFNLVIGRFSKDNMFYERGLWTNFLFAVQCAKENDLDYFIFCEDDHRFTDAYNKEEMLRRIENGKQLGSYLQPLGSLWVKYYAFDKDYGCFYLDRYACDQFLIVYKKAYDDIINFNWSYPFPNKVCGIDEDRVFVLDGVLARMFCPYVRGVIISAPYFSVQDNENQSDSTRELKDTAPDWFGEWSDWLLEEQKKFN